MRGCHHKQGMEFDSSSLLHPYQVSVDGFLIIEQKWTYHKVFISNIYSPNEQFSLRSGSSKLDDGGTVHQVTQVVRHNKYEDDDDDYDLCALRAHPPFEFRGAKPVKLPYPGLPLQDSWGRVTGWGYTEVRALD